jgi:signal transduction histidine kinase
MQQARQIVEFKKNVLAETGLAGTGLAGAGLAGVSVTERKRVVSVVETLTNLRREGESLAEVAHDARNMVTALGLYCDLLEEPGVLNPSFQHYAGELRLVATASRRRSC